VELTIVLSLNDSYSADISSLKIALDFLDRMQHHSRKTIILSDLLETGKNQAELYAQMPVSYLTVISAGS
jgi:alanine racemase